MIKVYLSGGMQNNNDWRNTVIRKCGHSVYFKEIKFIDPRCHEFDEGMPDHYTTWDLMKIKECDIVFAYMDDSNPSGYGLCVEVGYAKALGKPIIFVDRITDFYRKSYFGMVRSMSDIVERDLESGINTLREFVK